MPKGGARSNSGPPPAEHSQKKDRAAARAAKGLPPSTSRVIDDGEWLMLPREGRTANPPAWPLTKASSREQAVWRALWKRPQALGWERVGAEHQVAMYVRTLVRAEEPESPIGLTNQVRLAQHDLGLTAAGLRMLKWRIGQPPRAQQGGAEPATPAGPPPATAAGMQQRMGLRVVTAGGA